jgi:hypothetical protein
VEALRNQHTLIAALSAGDRRHRGCGAQPLGLVRVLIPGQRDAKQGTKEGLLQSAFRWCHFIVLEKR